LLDGNAILITYDQNIDQRDKKAAFDYTRQKLYGSLQLRRVGYRVKSTIEYVVSIIGFERLTVGHSQAQAATKASKLSGAVSPTERKDFDRQSETLPETTNQF
jgi:hypothetical protein